MSNLSDKAISWMSQVMALLGVIVWLAALSYFGAYKLALLVGVFAVPATVFNIIQEIRSPKPYVT